MSSHSIHWRELLLTYLFHFSSLNRARLRTDFISSFWFFSHWKKKVLVRHVLLVEQDRSRLKVEQSSRRTDGMLRRQCCVKHRRMLHWNSPCNIESKHWRRRLMLNICAMKRSQIRTFLFFAKNSNRPYDDKEMWNVLVHSIHSSVSPSLRASLLFLFSPHSIYIMFNSCIK